MTQIPFDSAPWDPETQFSEMLAQYDEALATASDYSTVSPQPFVSTLTDADLQLRFDRVLGCLQLLEQDRRRQAVSEARHVENAGLLTSTETGRTQTAAEPGVPHQIGRFRVIRRLGSGGFGVVFLAEDPVLRRNVAIKMPLATIFQSQELHDRFLRECRAAAMLNHPGIVRVLESGDVQGIPYQVAEFVDGERLSDLLKRQRPTVQSAAKMVRSLADAVQHAHDHGVLHRDIKPDNILMQRATASDDFDHNETLEEHLSRTKWNAVPAQRYSAGTDSVRSGLLQTTIQADPVPRITDFGLARVADDNAALSQSGLLVGTPKYMSPEQLHGRARLQGPPTDIYSLGVVLHELLTGLVPFADADSLQARIAISGIPVPSFRSAMAGISKDLETICLKCLRLRPDDRYASAGELRDDLSRYLDGRPTLARPIPMYEQFARWVAGNRRLAGLLGLLTLSVVVVLVQAIRNDLAKRGHDVSVSKAVSQWTAEKQRGDESLKLANTSRAVADRTELLYREAVWLAQQEEYSAAMMQASSLRHSNDIALMNQSLMPFQPQSNKELQGFEWRYLWDQGQLLRPLIGHTDFVADLAISKDGAHAWSIGQDHTVRRWHLKSGVLESTWKLERVGPGLRTAISHDIRRAVILRTPLRERMDEVTVLDLENGNVLMRRSFPHDDVRIRAVAVSNDGNAVLVGGDKGPVENLIPYVEVWNLDTGLVIHDDSSFRTLRVHKTKVVGRYISALAFAPDGNTLMIGVTVEHEPIHSVLIRTSLNVSEPTAQDDPISIFGPLTQFQSTRGIIQKMTISPTSKYLAAILSGGANSNWAEVWDLDHGWNMRATEEFARPIAMAFDSKGDARTTVLALGLTVPGLNAEGKPATPGENAVTEAQIELRLWDFVKDTKQVLPYQAKRDIAFLKPVDSFAGNDWFIGHGGGALNIWRPEAVSPYRELSGHRPKEAWDLAFSMDGSTIFSVGDDHCLRSWDSGSGEERKSAHPRSMLVSCVAVSPDGRWVAAGGYDDEVVVYDSESLNPVATLSGHTHDVRTLAFSPDSRLLATGGRDKVIRIWNVPFFDLAGTREGHNDAVRALTWTTDGRLISAGSDQRILVWDSNGLIVRERTEPEGVHSLAFAPAGLRVPRPTLSSTVTIANPESRTATASEEKNTQSIISVQADELLALGMNHGAVRLWHLPTDTVLFEAHHHGLEIRSLAFSPDGRTLAVGGSDEAVYLWHVATGRNVLTFDQLGSSVHRVTFSPDGTHLLAALNDGTIRIWHAPPAP